MKSWNLYWKRKEMTPGNPLFPSDAGFAPIIKIAISIFVCVGGIKDA